MAGGNIRSHNKSFEAHQMELNARFQGFLNQNTNRDHGQFFSTPEPMQKSFKDYLNLNQGGVLGSPLGYNPSKVSIISGAIDIGRESGKLAGHVIVSAESGTADILTDINNQVFGYQDITLQSSATDTLTVNTTGNINLGDGVSSLTLNPGEMLRLRYDTIADLWRVFLGASGGSSGLSEPIILTINTITPETLPTTSIIDWSKNPNYITLDRDVEFSFSDLPDSGSYEGVLVIIDVDATGGYATPVWPASMSTTPVVSTTALTRTSVMIYTIDGGTIVTHATSVGSNSGSVAQWATFDAVEDIDYATFDGINIDRLLFDQSAGNTLISTTTGLTSNASGDLLGNIPTGAGLALSINDVISLQMELVSSDMIFQIRGDSTNIPIFRTLQEKASSPTVGSLVGQLQFWGTDSTGVTQEQFASITTEYEDVTIGAVDGSLHLNAEISSSPTTFISLNNDNDGNITLWRDTSFNTAINLFMNSNKIYSTTDANDTFIEGDSLSIGFFIDDTTAKATFGTNKLLLATDYYIQSEIVEHRALTSDPSAPLDGSIWYNSTSLQMLGRINGATVDLGGGANTISQLDSNVTVTDAGSGLITMDVDGTQRYSIQAARADYADLPIFGLTALSFNSSSTARTTLTQNATDMTLNFADSTDIFNIEFNSNIGLSVDEVKTQIYSTTPNTTFPSLYLFRDDPSPLDDDVVGEIQFRGRDSAAANTMYGKMGVEIEDASAATSEGSFQWTVRHANLEQDMMSLKDGVLGISRHLPTAAAEGAALVLNRTDSGAAIGDEAGGIAFNIDDGTERNIVVINAVWDDTSVGDDSSRLDFFIQTDDTITNSFTLRGSPITSNKITVELSGESFIKSKSGVMGYFVTSDPSISSSIGDSGTIQIPQFDDGAPTLAQLNTAFGAFDGAMGQDISDGKLYVRKSSTVWSFYSESGTVV